MKYINIKSQYGTETIDQINRTDFNTYKEYKTELRNLITNYRLIGMNVYISQRACKDYHS